MATRLDVVNVSSHADPDALRACFERFGAVLAVRLVAGDHAFVTMASDSDARTAMATMDGAVFDARRIGVSEAREQPRTERAKVRLEHELRERCSVLYEIDHAGTPITIRMSPTDDGKGEPTWRIEATSVRPGDAVIRSQDRTRAGALESIARSWREHAGRQDLPSLDWDAIIELLRAVRAI